VPYRNVGGSWHPNMPPEVVFEYLPGFQDCREYVSQLALIHEIVTLHPAHARPSIKVLGQWSHYRDLVMARHAGEPPVVLQAIAEEALWNRWPEITGELYWRGAIPANAEPHLRGEPWGTKLCDNCDEYGHEFWKCNLPCFGCNSVDHGFPHCRVLHV
jgi:hypothetical protein